MNISTKMIRNRAWHFLNPGVAAAADMTLGELQQFIAGNFSPSSQQLRALAQRMGF